MARGTADQSGIGASGNWPPQRASLGTLALLSDAQGGILLVQATYDGYRWHLPGGYVEPNEAPEEALVRELNEELGITVEVIGIRCLAYKAYDPNLSLVYECRIISGHPIPDGSEIEACGYFAVDSWPLGLSDRTKKIIQECLTNPHEIRVITFKQP